MKKLEFQLNTIRICRSCTSINTGNEDTESFRQKVAEKLQELRPDLSWQVEPSPCLKVCPIGRITMTVTGSASNESRLTMSKEATVDSVVQDILSFFRPRTAD